MKCWVEWGLGWEGGLVKVCIFCYKNALIPIFFIRDVVQMLCKLSAIPERCFIGCRKPEFFLIPGWSSASSIIVNCPGYCNWTFWVPRPEFWLDFSGDVISWWNWPALLRPMIAESFLDSNTSRWWPLDRLVWWPAIGIWTGGSFNGGKSLQMFSLLMSWEPEVWCTGAVGGWGLRAAAARP